MQYTIAFYLPLAVAMHELSPKIIVLFFGESFSTAADVLRLLTWVTFPLTLAKLFANTLVIAGRPDLDLRVNAHRLVWNVVLSYVLIAQFGMIGACWAILLSTIASVFLQAFYLRDIAPLALSFAGLSKTCAALLVMIFALKLTSAWALIPQALLVAGIYAAAYLMMKPFDVEDRRLLHTLGRATATA